jgi:hypothetical protein
MFWRAVFFLAIVASLRGELPAPAQRPVDFAKDVQPILRARCLACHSGAQPKSGLRMEDRAGLVAGGYSGPVVKVGESAASVLIHRVAAEGSLMPMPPGPKRLSAAEVGILRAWIDQGMSWDEALAMRGASRQARHWAYEPIRKPGEPPVRDASQVRNPIDRFIQARLEREGVVPSPEARAETLVRRLYLDLTGLPPKPSDVRAYLEDGRPDAYERLVDRLLDSPHFGERWAKPWLDVARYADSDGYEKDWARPHAWRYRDWVIQALNDDMPFDQLTVEQVAGDLLPDATVEQRVAAGFHRNALTNREGGVDRRQFRFETTVDRANTVATVWLGMTMACAQCHDHKYDPISQRDYYSFFAFFDRLEEEDLPAAPPAEMLAYQQSRKQYREERELLLKRYCVDEHQPGWEKNILRAEEHPGERTDWDLAVDVFQKMMEAGDGDKILRKPAAERTEREQEILTNHFVKHYHFAVGGKLYGELKFGQLDKELAELAARYPAMTWAPSVREEFGPETRLRVRGDYKTEGIATPPATPYLLPKLGAAARATRLDLARWLVSNGNPLTARVLINRIWQEYFGTGIVKTAEDFGTQGDKPSHPELLDWLAADFRDHGWKVKRIHKLIVLSAAYRRTSEWRADLSAKDPENRLLARQARLRLPAELIRDSALAVSGLLDPRIGGRSVRPPQPAGVAELGYANLVKWTDSKGPDRYRRGLYIHFQRATPYPLLSNFDAPKGTVTVCRRTRSNTPLQALNLLNDPAFVESAQALAMRIQGGGGKWEEKLERAVRTALGRAPRAEEIPILRQYFEGQERLYASDAAAREQFGAADPATAAWIALSSVLMNVDEFITRE